MNAFNLFSMWFLVILCDIALFGYIIYRYFRARREEPDFSLRFRITDLWALAIGLSPCPLMIGAVGDTSPEAVDKLYVISALVIPHQVAGIFLIRIYLRSDSDTEIVHGAWRSFVDVLGGALIGMVLPLITIAILIGISVFLGTMPFSIAIAVLLYISHRNRRRTEEVSAVNVSPAEEPRQ